jgi:hypothetical protein
MGGGRGFGVVAVLAFAILWPRNWRFSMDPIAAVVNAERQTRSCPRLTAYSGLAEAATSKIASWIRHELVDAIDAAIANPNLTQTELSERLANAGTLPMFGFPTRVRALYERAP